MLTTLLTSVYWQHELAGMLVSTLIHAPVLKDFVCKWYFIIEPSFGADQESVMLLRSILSSYGDTCGFVFSTITSGTSAASASKKNPCSAAPNIGLARAYHFNVLTAEPPITSTLGGGRGANRFRGTIGSGIPSDIVPFFTDSGIVAILQADGLGISLGNVADAAPIKAYWNESVDF